MERHVWVVEENGEGKEWSRRSDNLNRDTLICFVERKGAEKRVKFLKERFHGGYRIVKYVPEVKK